MYQTYLGKNNTINSELVGINDLTRNLDFEVVAINSKDNDA